MKTELQNINGTTDLIRNKPVDDMIQPKSLSEKEEFYEEFEEERWLLNVKKPIVDKLNIWKLIKVNVIVKSISVKVTMDCAAQYSTISKKLYDQLLHTGKKFKVWNSSQS